MRIQKTAPPEVLGSADAGERTDAVLRVK
jgi:hypothetical protein